MISRVRRAIPLYAIALLAVLATGLVLAGCSRGTVEAPENAADTRVFKDVTPGEASDLIDQGDGSLTVLDVRTAAEFAGGHLEGAIDIDYYQGTFRSDLDKLDKGRAYLVYCRTAHRSTDAVSIMKELGFQEVYNMLGGIERWNQEGRPTVR
jgi:rhodanese-related sulfurtransferase